jgi:hypothetical protein
MLPAVATLVTQKLEKNFYRGQEESDLKKALTRSSSLTIRRVHRSWRFASPRNLVITSFQQISLVLSSQPKLKEGRAYTVN